MRAIGVCVAVAAVLAMAPAARAAGTWTVQSANAGKGVGLTCAVDESKAFAMGAVDDGQGNSVPVLLTTTNGGDAWTVGPLEGPVAGATVFLSDAACGTNGKCWAMGMSVGQTSGGGFDIRSRLISSSDGGKTWFWPQLQWIGKDWMFGKLDLVSDNDMWLSNGAVVIVHSTDGGATFKAWKEPKLSATEKFNSIADTAFLDDQTGFVVNSKSTVDENTKVETIEAAGAFVKTTDGGATWTALFTGRAEAYDRLEMKDANHGWLQGHTTSGIFLRRTRDGGQNWEDVAIPAPTGVDAITSIDGLWLFDAETGLMVGNTKVGENAYTHAIYEIRNGVLSEVLPDPLEHNGSVGWISCTPQRTCWIGTGNPQVLKYEVEVVAPPEETATGADEASVVERDEDATAPSDTVAADTTTPKDAVVGTDTGDKKDGGGCTAGALPGASAAIPVLAGLFAWAIARRRRP